MAFADTAVLLSTSKLAHILRSTSRLLLLLVFPIASFAQSSVWVASKAEERVYLGGTVHLLRASDYPLPQAYEVAYQDSDTLFFETDLAGLNDLSVQMRMLQELTYPEGVTLRTVLDADAYATLSTHIATIGLPMQMLEKFKPGMLVSTLQVIEFQKLGFTPQGVDAHFNSRALSDGKAVGELEPVEAQIGFISAMGEGNESEFIRLSLDDLSEIETSMEQMISAWRSGDNATLETLFVDEMRTGHPALYQSLLVQRNNAWLPLIEAMFQEAGTEFVLVGAAHLVGEDGLLHLLENRGYEITQLQ